MQGMWFKMFVNECFTYNECSMVENAFRLVCCYTQRVHDVYKYIYVFNILSKTIILLANKDFFIFFRIVLFRNKFVYERILI